MNDGFLSQEEIDSLLNGDEENAQKHDQPSNEEELKAGDEAEEDNNKLEDLTEIEKDLLGEIGNISMGSASTALSTIINQQVNITTPVVSVTTLNKLKNTFEVPNMALEVKYISGIIGGNLLVMKITDAAVIANLMMGGDGKVQDTMTLSEIEISAVSEAMNQMIGSAATSMATMFGREVNISPPVSKIWDDLKSPLAKGIDEDENVVKTSFSLTIGDLVDSHIMQLLPLDTAKKIVGIMMGQEVEESDKDNSNVKEQTNNKESQKTEQENKLQSGGGNMQTTTQGYNGDLEQGNIVQQNTPQYHLGMQEKPIEVQQAAFQPLGTTQSKMTSTPKNIDLIMDVPLDVSVVLGRSKLSIKEILNLGTGSLIELDRLAEEPVEILVNGKRVAYGEVVVIDENFGVRITSIVSDEEKVKSLGK